MLTRCAVAVSSFPKGVPSAPTAVYKTLFTIKPMQTGAFASQKQIKICKLKEKWFQGPAFTKKCSKENLAARLSKESTPALLMPLTKLISAL